MLLTILIAILGIGFVSSSDHIHSTNELRYECERNGNPDAYTNFMDFLKIFVEEVNTIKNRVLDLKETELYSEELLRTFVSSKLCLPLQDFEPILDFLKSCFDLKDYSDDELEQLKKFMHFYTCDFLLSAIKSTTEECQQETNVALQHCFNSNPSLKSLPTLNQNMTEAECKDVNTLLNCFGNLTRNIECGRRMEMKIVNFNLAQVLILSCDSWVF